MKFYQRRSLRLLALALVAAALLVTVVHTSTVRRFVAGWIESTQEGRLRIGAIDYRLWRGEIELRDVVWTQPELTASVPGATIHLTMNGLHRVEVRSPRVEWLGGAAAASGGGNDGGATIPPMPPARIEIVDGVLVFDALEASGIDITFEPSEGSFRVGRITYPDYDEARLEGRFALTGGTITIEAAELETYGATANVTGTIDLETNRQSFEAAVSALDLSQFDERLSTLDGRFSGSLEGFDYRTLEGSGSLTLAPDPEGELLVRVADQRIDFESERIAARGVEAAFEGTFAETLEVRFRASARVAELHEAASGTVSAEGTVSGRLDALRVEAFVRSAGLTFEEMPLSLEGNVVLENEQLRLRSVGLAHVSGARAVLDGTVGESLDLTGRASYERADLEAAVQASLRVTGLIGAPVVEGAFEADVGEGRLRGTGRFETGSRRIAIHGEGEDVSAEQVPGLVEAGVAGRLQNFLFEAEGTLDAPLITANALLTDLSYRGVALPETLITGETDGRNLILQASELLATTTVLEAPYLTRATLSLDALPLSELASTFPRAAETELSVSGEAVLELPLTDPAELRYRIEASNALGVYRDVVLGASSPFTIEGDRHGFRISELDLIGSDTAVGLDGTVPLSPEGSLNLDARGALRLDLLHLWFPEAAITGRANASIHLEGSLAEPEWSGDAIIDELSTRVGDVEVTAERISIDGQRDPPRPVRLQFRAENILAKAEAGEVQLSLSGELSSEDALLAHLAGAGRIESLVVRGGGFEMETREPASFALQDGRFTVDPVTFEEEQTTLVVSGEARPFDEVLAWSAELDGTLEHALLNPMLSELGLTYVGRTEIDVRASSSGGDILVEGGGSWRDARLTLRDPPLVFTNVTGTLELDGSSIELTSLTADAGGGKVAASGAVMLSGAALADVNLRATASSVRLSYPEGLRSEVEGDITLTGDAERLRLSGDVELNRAVFSRDIDVESELLKSVENVTGLSDPNDFAESVQLDIRVSAADGLRIDNNLARMEATANLTLGGTLGTPELRGVVATRPGGRFRFGRNDYLVQSGRIQLNAYPAEPAEVDIEARTTVRAYEIVLSINGPTDDLTTGLSAPGEPNLSQGDVASLLLTGRTLETVSSESRAILGEQMASYLGSSLGDLAQLGLGNALPFQIVTVEPALIAQEADPAARFTLGAALTNELTVVYSIGLDDAENQIWLVDYELPLRARTQLIRRQDNELSVGVSQTLHYDPNGRGRVERSRVTVGSVSIEYLDDEPPESAPVIQQRLRPRSGDRWDYWSAWDQAERIREQLREEGYLEATVDVVSAPCGERCIDVRYEATLGVPVAFLWRGDPVDDGLREAVKDAWNGQLGEDFVSTDIVTLAEGRLFAKRYYLAEVTATTQRTDQGVTVTVDFTRGPRGKDVAFVFEGNEALSDDEIREALPESNTAELYELLTAKRPRLKQLLELRYAGHGYLTAEIGDPELSYAADTGRLSVSIPLSENVRFVTDTIELEGVTAFERESLVARLALGEGKVFRPADFVQSRSNLASFYRQQGYPDVAVTASLLERDRPGQLGAQYVVNEGRRATVGTISVAGNESTKDSVVMREAVLLPGEALKLSDVNETQKRLYELGAFRSAEVVVAEPTNGEEQRDVTIRVREVPRLTFDYGLRVATDGLFQVDTEVGAPNLFGRAHHASFRTLIATDQKTFRLNYHMPYFARYKLGTDFFVEREFLFVGPQPIENDPTLMSFPFTDRTWRFTAQQTRVITRQLSLQWSYSFNRAATELEDPDFGTSQFTENTAVLSGSVVGDHRDNVVRPRRGSLWSATVQVAPSTLGSDSRFTKLYTQLYTFVTLGHDIVWAGGYRFGLAEDHGEPLDFDNGFRAGGPNSVRGFESRALGPVDELSREPFGGSGLLVFNQELRFPIIGPLRGVAFYDAGNAFASPSALSLDGLRQNLGIGARVEVPLGVLRFDWARVLDPREGETRSRFIFSLGHAF